MLNFIKDELTHVTDKYALELKKFYDRLETRQRVLEKKIEGNERQKIVLRDQEETNNQKLKIETDNLMTEKKRVISIQQQLSKDVAHYNKLSSSLSFDKVKSDLALQTTEGERDMAIAERKRQEKITQKYELKTASLSADFKLLREKQIEHDQREDSVGLKERVFNKKEQDRINKEHVLGEKTLWIQTQEKRIKLELARLKLNEQN